MQSLIECGAERTTTLKAQGKAEVSRGALLHPSSTDAALLAAKVNNFSSGSPDKADFAWVGHESHACATCPGDFHAFVKRNAYIDVAFNLS